MGRTVCPNIDDISKTGCRAQIWYYNIQINKKKRKFEKVKQKKLWVSKIFVNFTVEFKFEFYFKFEYLYLNFIDDIFLVLLKPREIEY